MSEIERARAALAHHVEIGRLSPDDCRTVLYALGLADDPDYRKVAMSNACRKSRHTQCGGCSNCPCHPKAVK